MGKKRRRPPRPAGLGFALWMIGIGCVLVVVAGAGWVVVKALARPPAAPAPRDLSRVSPELRTVLQETDRADPGWRLQDLATAQRTLPETSNGGLVALRAAQLVPESARASLGNAANRTNPALPVPEADLAQVGAALQACGPAVVEARKLYSFPDGVYPITFNFKQPIETLLPHAQSSRVAAQVLTYDAAVRAAERDGPGAAQDAAALLHLARYHRDEPFFITQLVRVAIRLLAVAALERSLTCANVPDSILSYVQQTLESEGAASPLRVSLRGERANIDAWAASVARGTTTWGAEPMSDDDVAWCLRLFNAALDLADQPLERNRAQWQKLDDDLDRAPERIKRHMPHIPKVRTALVRSTAEMRSAAVALAVERYRRAKGDWPADLKQLIPEFIKALPPDPFSGGPFLCSHQPAGLSVFSPGDGGCDFGGDFSAIGPKQTEGIGFRLLNPTLRH